MVESIQATFNLYNVISTLIGIMGIWFTLKSIKRIDFNYERKSFNLIDRSKNKFPNLEIKYAGQKIQDFTVTQIAVWNCGNRTINYDDFASSGYLSIDAMGTSKLLDAAIISISDESNKLSIRPDTRKIDINFEYLKPRQGASIQIIHTGDSSDLKIHYTLKESKNKNSINYEKKANFKQRRKGKLVSRISTVISSKEFKKILILVEISAMFMLSLSLMLTAFNIIPQSIINRSNEIDSIESRISITVATVMSGFLFISTLISMHSRVPKELQSFQSLLAQDCDNEKSQNKIS